MPFIYKELEIKDVILITPKVFNDDRGYFYEVFKSSDFIKHGIDAEFKQMNQSKSSKNVLRGLHYQLKNKEQGKLVRVINGSIFDVCVDIRQNSKTYGKWVGEFISSENKKILWIPPGFAHGFVTFEDNTIVSYLVTNEYSKSHERSLNWNDPTINIDWHISSKPLVSPKDNNAPFFDEIENNFY